MARGWRRASRRPRAARAPWAAAGAVLATALTSLAACAAPRTFVAPARAARPARVAGRAAVAGGAAAAEAPVADAADAPAAEEGEGETSSLVPELIALAEAGDRDALFARADADFGKLSTEDINELQLAMNAAYAKQPGVQEVPPKLVSEAIQAAVQTRMAAASETISALIESADGDVNIRVRRMLKAAESPLPLLMVLQLNIQTAYQESNEEKARILMHIYTLVNEELEKKVSRVNGLLNKLMRMDNAGIRDNVLRHHLTPVEVAPAPDLDGDGGGPTLAAALVRPSQLSAAIATLVENTDMQMKATVGPNDDLRFENMDRIREVAKEARIVIGDVYGEAEMNQFGADLTPAFTAIMEWKARQEGRVPEPDAPSSGSTRPVLTVDGLKPPPGPAAAPNAPAAPPAAPPAGADAGASA